MAESVQMYAVFSFVFMPKQGISILTFGFAGLNKAFRFCYLPKLNPPVLSQGTT